MGKQKNYKIKFIRCNENAIWSKDSQTQMSKNDRDNIFFEILILMFCLFYNQLVSVTCPVIRRHSA